MTDSDKYLEFKSSWGRYEDNRDGTYYMARPRIKFTWDFSWTRFVISNINIDRRYDEGWRYLDTENNPGTPYDPQYPWSPATKKYVDDSVSTAVASTYKYKWSVASYSNLPASGNTEGDVWNVIDTGMNYAWTWSAWDALGATVDLSNYIAKNNTTAFTPSGDYNPSTKKYVDDTVASAKSSWATAPSNPTEWQLWYDTTNDQLKVYDWTNWNVVWDDAADINTKTFYISSASDLTNAQAAVDWYLAGGNPIVVYWTWNEKKTFVLNYIYNDTSFIFTTVSNKTNDTSTSTIYFYRLRLSVSSWTVTNIYYENYSPKYLDASYNYWTPYTPLYNGSPATKKYVDDNITSINSQSWALSLDIRWSGWVEVTDYSSDWNFEYWIWEKDFTFLESNIISNWVWWIIDNYTLKRPSKLELTTIYSNNYSTPFWTVLDITSVDTNNKRIIAEWILRNTDTSWIYAWKDFLFVYEITYDNSQNVVNTYQREYHIFNPWWTLSPGNVLTYTWNGVYWWNAPTWGIQNDTTWTTSTIEAEWVWTKAEFNALSSYWNKIYNIIE